MKVPLKTVGLALVITVLGATVAQSPPTASPNPPATLRIGLWTLWHDREITVAPPQESSAVYRLCENCAASPLTGPMRIRASEARLALDDKREAGTVWLTGPVTLTAHGETLTLRNPLRISARSGELVFAAILPVETYVERVVASESGPADGPESLKALAIVVRTFALHQAHGHTDYDLCDSTHCQLLHWGGNSERQAAAHAATLATAGETLWFHGQRAQAWFHQNCGGRTASPQEVWPATTAQGRELASKPVPWLISRIDPYCTSSGAREWSAEISASDLTAALARAGLARPGWSNLTVVRRGESGRAVVLALDSAQISAEDFRLAVGRSLGWSRILSAWFEVSRQGDRFLFHGRGSGHGVGLCQAGAAAMSAQGRDSIQILAQYFPGAIAADESTGQPWQRLQGQGYVLETLNPADSADLAPLNHALAEAEARSGLPSTQPVTVRAFPSTRAFRDATLAPGWVAAFTEGNWIATQPLSTLAVRKLLAPVLRHEFLHALVEARAAPATPLWFREGIVEALDNESKRDGPAPTLKLDQIDRALAHAATESQSQVAHRAAAWYAALLLAHFGRDQVIGWLRTGLPGSALAGLR
jgi:stage II sporulation protein D